MFKPFLKLLKEQDSVLKTSPDLKTISFGPMIATVEIQVRQLLEIKSIKLTPEGDISRATYTILPGVAIFCSMPCF